MSQKDSPPATAAGPAGEAACTDGCCSTPNAVLPPVAPAGTQRRLSILRTVPQRSGDACCGPDEEPVAVAGVVEEDGCCGPDPAAAAPGGAREPRPSWWRDPALLAPAAAGVLLLVGYALGVLGASTAGVLVHALALACGAWTFVPGAIRRLIRGRLGVGLLMTIAAAGAVALGHIAEAAALAFLFSLAEALEDRAMDRAKDGLRSLLSLVPETARVSRLRGEERIPVAQVRELDILIIGAGERVATDGVVVEGSSSLDTSAVTGESIPVDVAPGSAVPAGSVNGSGTLQIEATADGRDNSLTQIVALVEQANARKGERARLADRIARPLVPAVLVIALAVVVFGFIVGDPMTWVERALVVLVAASPCALAIAVPVTVISAIGSASKLGIVIKSGQAFEQLGSIRHVALDKTGTLTRNEPTVVAVQCTPGTAADRALAMAAALEATSSHPLAAAITHAATGPRLVASGLSETPGHGIAGLVDGHAVQVGNTRWLDPGPLAGDAESMAQAGMTVVAVSVDGAVTALIGVRDEPRPEAAETVRMLTELGVSTTMLTGDNRATAHAVAQEVGITDVRAEQLPADKAAEIASQMQRQPTAMVGDGINDAPALATATVGIAMGLKGSAAAIESADVAFTGTDLRQIPRALAHARRGYRIMTVNIALALAIIIVLFPLALFGVLGLAGVVLVHEIAEVIVILNGARAARRPRATLTPGRQNTLVR